MESTFDSLEDMQDTPQGAFNTLSSDPGVFSTSSRSKELGNSTCPPVVVVFQPPLRTLFKNHTSLRRCPLVFSLEPAVCSDICGILVIVDCLTNNVVQTLCFRRRSGLGELELLLDMESPSATRSVHSPVFSSGIVIQHKTCPQHVLLVLNVNEEQVTREVQLRLEFENHQPFVADIQIASQEGRKLDAEELALESMLFQWTRGFELGSSIENLPYIDPDILTRRQ